MKRVSTVLIGTLALLLLSGNLLAAGDELTEGRVGATTAVAGDITAVDDGFWHAPPGHDHAERATLPDASFEIKAERSEFTKIFQVPDEPLGRIALVGSAPVHYRGPSGEWEDIDTTIVPKGGTLSVVKHSFQTFFADRVSADHLTEVRNRGHWLRMGKQLSLLVEDADAQRRRLATRVDGVRGRAKGNTAVYEGALGGDIVVRVTNMRVEQHVVLGAAPEGLAGASGGTVVLRERVQYSPGLSVFVDEAPLTEGVATGEQVIFVDEGADLTVGVFQRPVALETNRAADQVSGPAIGGHYLVRRESDDTLIVEKVFPADWFRDGERVYPVTIDPTVTLDTTVDAGTPSGNSLYHTGFVYKCTGCTGGEYERVFTYNAPAPNHYSAYGGDRLRLYVNGDGRQMKIWMRFDISGMFRYVSNVQYAILSIWMSSVEIWPAGHDKVRFTDVNMDVCEYDSKTYGEDVYSAIDGGALFLESDMGGTSGGHCNPDAQINSPLVTGAACMAPHYHDIDLCGTAPAIIKANRNANIGYFNVGIELSDHSPEQDLRFEDRWHTHYPRVAIRYDVECTPNQVGATTGVSSDCNDHIGCTDNICNNGRCEYPYTSTMCYIDNVCYNQNYVNPNNQCQKCAPGTSHTQWTNDNGLACTDGLPCTKGDHCDAGSCQATPYTCEDGKDCTTDICNGDGSCTFQIDIGTCLIDGVCYNRGDENPSEPCQECRDDWNLVPHTGHYSTHWGYNNANPCTDNDQCTFNDHCNEGACDSTAYSCNDFKGCTQDICNGDSTCTHNILAGTCFIGSECYVDEQTSPFNDCKKCDANVTQTAWTNWAHGHACANDGKVCTTDICSGTGTCLHNIDDGTCLIANICYVDFQDHPGDRCKECNSTISKTAWANVPNNTVSQACYPCTGGGDGIGICTNGIQWCTNGAWGACSGMQCPEPDICDYLDNDCDGNTDEDYPTLATACDGGDYDACVHGTRTCKEDASGVECVNDGAIAFFRFEEGTGAQVHTSSGIVTTAFRSPPRTGLVSGANWTPSGWNGSKALIFDGVDDYVDIPHHTTMDMTSAVTMESWIYPTAASGVWRVIGGLYNGGSGGYYMAVNFTQGPGFSGWFGAACGWKYSNQVPPLNRWTHVAASYDGATVKLFMNGAKVLESACTGNGGSLGASTSPLHIGGLGAYNPTQAPWAGAIDDFGVYDTTLTEAEIKARAREGDSCDGADNDCDGLVDEALYPDLLVPGPPGPDGPVTVMDPTRVGRWDHKFAPCDGADNDWCINGTYTCSADNLAIVCTNESPNEVLEICDGLDNDCNLVLPLVEHDDDNDNYMICEGDCDDNSTIFNPGHPEICDGFDNNCDNTLPVAEQDLDSDLHMACIPGELYSDGGPLDWADCDDANPRVHKDYPEVCDTLDNDCDGQVDDADGDYLVPRVDSFFPVGVAAGSTEPGNARFGPQTYDVTFYGKNFVPTAEMDVTTFDFGYGVNVNSVAVNSTQEIVVNITVKVLDGDDEQLLKQHDVTIQMGNCVLVLDGAFDVFDPDLVPTLTEWGVIGLGTLLLGFGIVAIRRRRRHPLLAG